MHHEAIKLATAGFHVIPIGPGQKHPPIPAWQKAATTNPDTINAWWTGLYRGHGIGIATGYDDLFVIDLDTHGTVNGLQTWIDLCDQHPNLDIETVVAITGSGGLHLYMRAPHGVQIRNDASRRLGPGIDIRGIGGQVLAPPTIHPNGTAYRWNENCDPWTVPIATAPNILIELLTTEHAAPMRTVTSASTRNNLTSTIDDETPMHWFNRTITWDRLLTDAGWHLDHTDRTGEQHWTRPGKNGGTSATVGYQGTDALHIFTSSIPELPPDETISKFRFHSLTNHHGDDQAAARHIRSSMQPATPFTRTIDLTVQPTNTSPARNSALLPDEFWTARPTLTHIRTAAWSRMLAPDGLLGATLARLAALTNHAWKLPATIGAEAGLDYFAALVGQPGAGKGRSMSVATQLLPNPPAGPSDGSWLAGRFFDGPIGSGEGMVRAFYHRHTEPDEKGKPHSSLIQNCWNALFRIDEGEALDKLARRSDQTTMTTLRQMFSSEELGATYANEDKNLRVRHYRCGLVMGIQPTRARFLLDDANGGTPARFTWWNLHDPHVPLDGPEWPGPLQWTAPRRNPGAPSHYGADGTAIDLIIIHPNITNEIRQIRHAFLCKGSDDPLHGHLTLVKLKTAALLAHLESRTDINLDDWALAGIIIETSNNVRNGIAQTIRNEDTERTRNTARKAASIRQAELAAEDDHTDRKINQLVDRIVTQTTKHGPTAWRNIQQRLSGGNGALRQQAKAVALEQGRIIELSNGHIDIPNRAVSDKPTRRRA